MSYTRYSTTSVVYYFLAFGVILFVACGIQCLATMISYGNSKFESIIFFNFKGYSFAVWVFQILYLLIAFSIAHLVGKAAADDNG